METAAHRELASLLLAAAMSDQTDPAALPEVGARAFEKLCHELVELVTKVGSRALFARALYLTRPEFPFFAGVRAEPGLDTALEGLHNILLDVEPEQAREGLAALLANLIGLLVTFIGEDLTLGVLAAVWPDVSHNRLSPEEREG